MCKDYIDLPSEITSFSTSCAIVVAAGLANANIIAFTNGTSTEFPKWK